MKRLFSLLLPLLLLTGCGASASPVVQVALRARDTQEVFYEVVDTEGKTAKTAAFDSDDLHIYTVDCLGIDCQVVDGKVQNTVEYISITDEKGQAVEEDTLTHIVHAVSTIDHDIFTFTILEDQGAYFAFLLLNTNWSSPCLLYRYHPGSGNLELLHQWDNVDLLGLQLVEKPGPSRAAVHRQGLHLCL